MKMLRSLLALMLVLSLAACAGCALAAALLPFHHTLYPSALLQREAFRGSR